MDIPNHARGLRSDFISSAVIGSRTWARRDPNEWVLRVINGINLSALVGEPITKSEISNRPAYIFDIPTSTRDLRLRLTEDEIERLIRRNLTPSEYRILLDNHGEFFDIHDDFYDAEGNALQPHI